jgi:hypothetical protein
MVSAAGAGEERGDDVGGVAVERDSGAVVAHGGASVGVAGGFLDVAERHPGVERGGDERVAQCVGPHTLGDARASGDAAHDPTSCVAIDPPAVGAGEDRSLAAFPDCEIDGPGRPGREGHGHDLASLAPDRERAVAALQAEVLDVRADGFGNAQPVERQETDERVIPGAAQAGGDQHAADLIAVQAGGMGLVIQARSPHMSRRRGGDETFLFGVAVEAGHGAQPRSCACVTKASSRFVAS